MKISRRGLAKWLFGAAAVGAVANIPMGPPPKPTLIPFKFSATETVMVSFENMEAEYNKALGELAEEAEYAARWRRLGSV